MKSMWNKINDPVWQSSASKRTPETLGTAWGIKPSNRDPKKNQEIREYNRTNKDPDLAKMPFGKYRGYFLKDVPLDYLAWACDNIKDKAMNRFLKEEYNKRTKRVK